VRLTLKQVVNIFNLDNINEIQSSFPQITNKVLSSALHLFQIHGFEEIIDKRESDDYISATIDDCTGQFFKLIIYLMPENHDKMKVNCSCKGNTVNKLCEHVLAIWFEHTNTLEKYDVENDNYVDYVEDDDLIDEDFSFEDLFGEINDPQMDDQIDSVINEVNHLILDGKIRTEGELFSTLKQYLIEPNQKSLGTSRSFEMQLFTETFIKFDPDYFRTTVNTNTTTNKKKLKNKQSKDLVTWFNDLNNYAKLGYLLLFSDHEYQKKDFRKIYKHLIENYISDDEIVNQRYVDFLELKKGLKNTAKVISVAEGILLHHIQENFNQIISDMKNQEDENAITLKQYYVPFDILGFINYLANIFSKHDKIITQKNEMVKRVVKKCLADIDKYHSLKLNQNQKLYLIEFTTLVMIISQLIIINSDRGVMLTKKYYNFLTQPESEQKLILANGYFSVVKPNMAENNGYNYDDENLIHKNKYFTYFPQYEPRNFHRAITRTIDYLYLYIKPKLQGESGQYGQDLIGGTNNGNKICRIHQFELLLDYYKVELENLRMNRNSIAILDLKEYKPLNIVTRFDEEFRPKVGIVDIYYSNNEEVLFNLLQFEFSVLGFSTPLMDENGRIRAYDLNLEALDLSNRDEKLTELKVISEQDNVRRSQNKSKSEMSVDSEQHYNTNMSINVIKSDEILILPDFTIKADRNLLTKETIQWLMEYIQIENLSNYIEGKLTKEKVWQFMDRNENITDYLEKLTLHSKHEIPANVIVTLNDWSKQYGFAQIIDDTVLTIPEPNILDNLLNLKSMQKINIIRLSPTSIMFNKIHKTKIVKHLETKKYHIKETKLES
jgi:hypothetical protein